MPRRLFSHSPWERVAPLRLETAQNLRRSAKDHRECLDAVWGIARTSTPWRDLPEALGRWHTVCPRVRRGALNGGFKQGAQALSADADVDYGRVDGTTGRLHSHGAGAKGGRLGQLEVIRVTAGSAS